jgi:hypothetical protein
MYKEYELLFPRDEIFNDNENDFSDLFKKLLVVLKIEISMELLKTKCCDEYNAGEGDLLVFHNVEDTETFISIDLFCHYTDQLDITVIGIRVHEDIADRAKEILVNISQSYWHKEHGTSNLYIEEHFDNKLKLKTINYENSVFERALQQNREHRYKTEQMFKIKGIGYREIVSDKANERKRRIEQQKHQPIFHYVNEEIFDKEAKN